MAGNGFTHLHVHSEYSLLDGAKFKDERESNILFIAAANAMKAQRAGKLAPTHDQFASLGTGPKSPEDMNKINAEHYGPKK